MDISFRKIDSIEKFDATVEKLISDVKENGGTCSETVDVWGDLIDIHVTSSPWGPIVIKKEVDRLEALAIWFNWED